MPYAPTIAPYAPTIAPYAHTIAPYAPTISPYAPAHSTFVSIDQPCDGGEARAEDISDETEIPELPLASGKGSLEDGELRRHSTFEPAPEMMMATARADDFA